MDDNELKTEFLAW